MQSQWVAGTAREAKMAGQEGLAVYERVQFFFWDKLKGAEIVEQWRWAGPSQEEEEQCPPACLTSQGAWEEGL